VKIILLRVLMVVSCQSEVEDFIENSVDRLRHELKPFGVGVNCLPRTIHVLLCLFMTEIFASLCEHMRK